MVVPPTTPDLPRRLKTMVYPEAILVGVEGGRRRGKGSSRTLVVTAVRRAPCASEEGVGGGGWESARVGDASRASRDGLLRFFRTRHPRANAGRGTRAYLDGARLGEARGLGDGEGRGEGEGRHYDGASEVCDERREGRGRILFFAIGSRDKSEAVFHSPVASRRRFIRRRGPPRAPHDPRARR